MACQSKRPLRFVLEGGVGSGKTTIIKELAKLHPNWEFFEEPIARWKDFDGKDYLAAFYADTKGKDKCKDLQRVIIWSYKELMEGKPKKDIQIFERSALSAVRIFSPSNVEFGNLSPEELAELQQQYEEEIKPLGEMNGWIFLRTSPEMCHDRMIQRQSDLVDKDVLDLPTHQTFHKYHEEFFQGKEMVCVIDEMTEMGELGVEEKTKTIAEFILKNSGFRFDNRWIGA